MPIGKHVFALPVMAALLPLTVPPAAAAPAPYRVASPAWSADPGTVYNNRHWHHRRDRGGIDAGEVVAGVLVIGAIAAIAGAASRDDDRRERLPRDPYPSDRGTWRGDYRASDGLARAADMCVAEVERERRGEDVEQVDRRASGWIVSGTTEGGGAFTCTIGNDGMIGGIDYRGGDVRPPRDDRYDRGDDDDRYDDDRYDDDRYSDDRYDDDDRAGDDDDDRDDRQWDARRYAEERERLDRQAGRPPVVDDTAQPAYPGGPLPGEDEGSPDDDDDYI